MCIDDWKTRSLFVPEKFVCFQAIPCSRTEVNKRLKQVVTNLVVTYLVITNQSMSKNNKYIKYLLCDS